MAWTPEQHREYMRAYRKKHRDRLRAQTRAWKAAHPERVRAAEQRRYKKNKAKIQERALAWARDHYANDPEYREKTKAAKRQEYHELRQKLVEVFGTTCAKCSYAGPLHLDHIEDDGYIERKKWSQSKIYRNALKEPHRYQWLCPNHNSEKRAARQKAPGKVGRA